MYFQKNIRAIVALSIIIIAFIAFKIPYLSLSYFWDEAWSYVPGVRAMYENGLGLLPGSLDAHYSKGHPLLFYFLSALWMNIFGTSHTAVHLFPMLISVLVLLISFFIVKNYKDNLAAIATVLLISVQAVFLTQSGLLLPEMLLSLFILIAVYSIVQKKYYLFILITTALILTKESGIIMSLTAFLWLIYEHLFIQRKTINKSLLVNLFYVSVPVIVFLVYLVIQKISNGWFFYPAHANEIDFAWRNIVEKLNISIYFSFVHQSRNILFSVFVLVSLLIIIKETVYHKNKTNRILLFKYSHFFVFIAVLLIYFYALNVNKQWSFLYLQPLCFVYFVYVIVKYVFIPVYKKNNTTGSFLIVALIFITFYFLFSSVNFYTKRYMLSAIILSSLSVVLFVRYVVRSNILFIFIFAVVTGKLLFQNTIDEGINDINLSYRNAAVCQRDVTYFCEENISYRDTIYSSFLMAYNLDNKYTDCLSKERVFENVTTHYNRNVNYCIINSFENANMRDTMLNNKSAKLLMRFEQKNCWYEIYKLKKENTNKRKQ